MNSSLQKATSPNHIEVLEQEPLPSGIAVAETQELWKMAAEQSQGLNYESSRMRIFAGWIAMFMRPGIGVKRWLALLFLGLLFLASGIAFAASISVSEQIANIGRTITFANRLAPIWRGLIFGGTGGLIALGSIYMLLRQISFGARYTQGTRGIIESLTRMRRRSTGPQIVAIGGGTGLSTLLRGLKQWSDNITAIVTVADDGGSSGRLRRELGISPPGDARQCLIALSEAEPLMDKVLSYRFDGGDDLKGHNVGNLLLAALIDTEGDFHSALQGAARLLNVRGQVMPSTLSSDVKLVASVANGTHVQGESAIGQVGAAIDSIWIDPPSHVNPAVLKAVAKAELIVIGPGSLFTSLLPNFLVEGLSDAVNRSHAPKVLVCNVASEVGETDNFTARDHLCAFQAHSGVKVTHFLVNTHLHPIPPEVGQHAIEPINNVGNEVHVIRANVVDDFLITHHDSRKLAIQLLKLVPPRR